MPTSLNSFIFFLLISIAFSITITATSLATNNQKNERKFATVHIINALPKNSSGSLNLRCVSRHTELGVQTLKGGDEYNWIVTQRALFYCEALWIRFIASWHAFQPKRDSGHDSVFWKVQENGFFLSWDNSTWIRRAVWETE